MAKTPSPARETRVRYPEGCVPSDIRVIRGATQLARRGFNDSTF